MSCKLCSNKHTQWNVLSCGHFFGASCIEKQGCFEFVSKEEHADCINWFHSTAPAMSHYIYKCGIKALDIDANEISRQELPTENDFNINFSQLKSYEEVSRAHDTYYKALHIGGFSLQETLLRKEDNDLWCVWEEEANLENIKNKISINFLRISDGIEPPRDWFQQNVFRCPICYSCDGNQYLKLKANNTKFYLLQNIISEIVKKEAMKKEKEMANNKIIIHLQDELKESIIQKDYFCAQIQKARYLANKAIDNQQFAVKQVQQLKLLLDEQFNRDVITKKTEADDNKKK